MERPRWEIARPILEHTGIPVLTDLDTGYSGAINIRIPSAVRPGRSRRRDDRGPGLAEALWSCGGQRVVPAQRGHIPSAGGSSSA